MTSDRVFQLGEKFSVEIAAVQGKRLQVSLVRKRLNEGSSTLATFLKVIMSEEQVCELGVTFKTLAEK